MGKIISCFISLFLLDLISAQTFTHSTSVNFNSGPFEVKWFFTDTEITFEASAPTTGWVGVGFNNRNDLRGGDFFVSWIEESGPKKHSQDSKIETYLANLGITVVKDVKSDYELLPGYPKQENQNTVVRFKRKLSTCDFEHDYALDGNTVNLIMAFGATDPRVENLNNPGPQLLQLSNAQTSGFFVKPIFIKGENFVVTNVAPTVTADMKLWNISIDNDQITSPQPGFWEESFLYNCKLSRVPVLDQNSFIGFSPITEYGTDRKIYNTRVFACPTTFALASYASQNIKENVPFECKPNEPARNILSECSQVIASSGAGGTTTKFPDNTGYSLTASQLGGKYVILQVIYDTSISRRGKTGLAFHLANKAVERNAGEFAVVSDSGYRMVVPPRVEETRIRTICDLQCTKKAFPEDGIRIFAVSHHTRAFGRQVRTRLVRGGKEVAVISEDSAHTWFFEPTIVLNKAVEVKRGDQIIVDCTYNTLDMPSPRWLFGGPSSSDEHCGAVFHYYPRIENFFHCGSAPEPRNVFPLFSISDYESELGVSGNNSQYNVNADRFRQLAQLQDTKPDKCMIARINALSHEKHHLPFCGEENLDLIRTGEIELLPLEQDKNCPNAPSRAHFNHTWPASCYKMVYSDEIPAPVECPKQSSGIKSAASFGLLAVLMTFSSFISGF